MVALTKIDLVDDPEWLDLVEADVAETLARTVLASAPIVRVSARTGEGLPALLGALDEALVDKPRRLDLGRPRLPVDRVPMPGLGPSSHPSGDGHRGRRQSFHSAGGVNGRVRGLQTHKRKEQTAVPGGRHCRQYLWGGCHPGDPGRCDRPSADYPTHPAVGPALPDVIRC